MKVLLDENIPVGLAPRLAAEGWEVEHPVLSGRRGRPDAEFFARIAHEPDLVFLTQDEDFAAISSGAAGQVVISRIRQERPLAVRLELWREALDSLRRAPRAERLFELLDDGTLAAWEVSED